MLQNRVFQYRVCQSIFFYFEDLKFFQINKIRKSKISELKQKKLNIYIIFLIRERISFGIFEIFSSFMAASRPSVHRIN